MKTLKTLMLASCLALIPGLALAQVGDTEEPQDTGAAEQETQRFQDADKDNSGKLSEAEAQEAGVSNFAEADRNGDGELDRSEFYLAMNQQ